MVKAKKTTMVAFGIVIVLLSSATITGAVGVLKDINNLSPLDTGGSKVSTSWTVMFYFAGDHHRGREIEYTQNFLKDIGSTEEVNLVGLFDGTTHGDTFYCYVEKDLIIPLEWYEIESNMADPDTFEKFLTLTMYQYPADKYALFTLSAWGSGWQGVFSDTSGTSSSKTLDLINMPEIGGVLKTVTNNGSDKIDFYGIDVCVPGNVEVASEIAPYVDYMVANEEHGFGGPDEQSDDGLPLEWNYTGFIQQLVDNPSMTPEEFAITVVDTYIAGTYTTRLFGKIMPPDWIKGVKYHTDLSATNLKEINMLEQALDVLGAVLKENLGSFRKEIKQARLKTREYGKLYRRFFFLPSKLIYVWPYEPLRYDCFIDVYDFADKMQAETQNITIQNACQQVKDAINTTVIANEAEPDDPTHGLSIYFPKLRIQYDQSIWRGMGNKNFRKISSYKELIFTQNTNWDEFLEAYLKI